MREDFILKGNICYSRNLNTLEIAENHYVVCVEGKSKGVFKQIPEEAKYENLEYADKAYSIFTNNLKKVQLHEHVYLQQFIVKQQCF